MSPVMVVFFKEWQDCLRDRRTLLNALLFGPLTGPLIFIALLWVTLAGETAPGKSTSPLTPTRPTLPAVVIGADRAPDLIQALRERGLQPLPEVADISAALREERVDLALRIGDTFTSQWQGENSAPVEVLFNSSRVRSLTEAQQLRALLEEYAQHVSAARLEARGLPPALAAPLVVTSSDQATARARGAAMFTMLPYFLILSAYLGGMWLSIDSTAGERERQSLEPLFINPVAPAYILFGKVLAAGLVSLISLTLSLVVFTLASWLLPSQRLGMTLGLTPATVVMMIAIMLPLLILLVTVQIHLAARAKSVRAAQAYLSLLQFGLLAPSLLFSVLPLGGQDWVYAVPLLAQQQSIATLMRIQSVPPLPMVLSVVITLALAAVFLRATRRGYESEGIILTS
jgi:sodium transport system permease protein